MNSRWNGFGPKDGQTPPRLHVHAPSTERLAGPVRLAITRSRQWLLDQQEEQGFWEAELEGDSSFQSETVLTLAFLGREESDLAEGAARRLLETQTEQGGWAKYPGGPIDVSDSVKAYFALKLTGHEPSEEPMQRARRVILALGGADAADGLTRFFLAILGQIPHHRCPRLSPERILLPKQLPASLSRLDGWSRALFVPLSIVSARRPVRHVDASRAIRELFVRRPAQWPRPTHSGGPFRRLGGALLHRCARYRLTPLRRPALDKAKTWILARLDESDGLGASISATLWSLIALRGLDVDDAHPAVAQCYRQLEALVLEDPATGSLRLQPCRSPVADTTWTLKALLAGGLGPNHAAVRRAVDWLLDAQTIENGDWSQTVRAEPGGWPLQHANRYYPDCGDTALALSVLQSQFEELPEPPHELPPELSLLDTRALPEDPVCHAVRMQRTTQATNRGLRWLVAMQNGDGGWGTFDHVAASRSRHEATLNESSSSVDASAPDLTGRVLETLAKLGCNVGHPAVDKAVAYLRTRQEPDGSWFGKTGVNYVYGTWQALLGMTAVGVSAQDPDVVAGAGWLLAHQQPCGGWGESPDSYENPTLRGQGPTTATQTAWAVMGLIAAGQERHAAVQRGIQFLIDRQVEDGTWEETEFTGRSLPGTSALRYHGFPVYFPLMALSRFAMTTAAPQAEVARPRLRLVRSEEEVSPRWSLARG